MVAITLYGGVREIGGNKILVEDENTRIMLDFGTRMGFEGNFFAEFLQPRTNTGLKDRLTIGALPRINGIYREDLFRPDGIETLDNTEYSRILDKSSSLFSLGALQSYEEYNRKEGRSYLDAVLVSHCHIDHTGAIEFLHPKVPMYCSKETEILVKAIDEVSSFKSKAIESKSSEISFLKDKAMFPHSPELKHSGTFTRPCTGMDDGQQRNIGSMKVTHLNQDHSVPGASSFLVETSGKTILYTGDIRFHGTYPMTIDEYIGKIGTDVDIMICEGTRVDSENKITEKDIKNKIEESIRQTKGLVFIDFSWKDTTRYETVRDAAHSSGRTLVINARLAYILKKLGMYPEDDDNIKVFLKRKSSCLYSPSDYKNSKYELGFSVDKENLDLTHYENALTAQDIKAHPEKYVMMMSFFDLGQIFDLADEAGKIPEARLIRAQCEPFSDEMELDEEQFINWLTTFGIDYDPGDKYVPDGCMKPDCEKLRSRIDRSHVSGHASRPELKELIEKINPKTLIPVHTDHPEAFLDIVTELGADISVILPEYGKRIDIS